MSDVHPALWGESESLEQYPSIIPIAPNLYWKEEWSVDDGIKVTFQRYSLVRRKRTLLSVSFCYEDSGEVFCYVGLAGYEQPEYVETWSEVVLMIARVLKAEAPLGESDFLALGQVCNHLTQTINLFSRSIPV